MKVNIMAIDDSGNARSQDIDSQGTDLVNPEYCGCIIRRANVYLN